MEQSPVLPDPIRLEVVRVQPGDVLVLTCNQHLSEHDVEQIRERVEQAGLDSVKTLVLSGGMHMDVVRYEGGQ